MRYEIKTMKLVIFLTRTASSPKLDLPYDSCPSFDPSQLNEFECSVQFVSVSEHRILLIVFSMSAFFDKAEVI